MRMGRNGIPVSVNREEACRTVMTLAPFLLFSFSAPVPHDLHFSSSRFERMKVVLQPIWEDERINSEDVGFTMNVNCWVFFCFSCCRDKTTAGTILVCVYAAIFLCSLCVALFFFSFSVFSFGFLGGFFLSPFLTVYNFSGFLAFFLAPRPPSLLPYTAFYKVLRTSPSNQS